MGGYSFGAGVPTWNGIPMIGAFQKDFSGSTYFVDNNSGSDGNKGNSWEKPFKTLAKAIAISNINIAGSASRWARRNTIFYAADTETVTLVAFPNKCDVIGCGSYDANKMAGITGNHAPVNAANYGTRFFNVWFKAPAVASPIVALASSSSGIEFHGCMFDGTAGTVTTGITATVSPFLRVFGCEFMGAFATANISLASGALVKCEIIGNRMMGSADAGVLTNSGTTVSYGGWINNNYIRSAGICINDASSKFYIIGNRGISTASDGTAGAGNVVGNVKFGNDNVFSGNAKTFIWPAYAAMA
jgi:hypothetical protein